MIAPHCREYICFYFNLNDVVQNEIKKIDTMTCYIKLLTPNGSLEESGEYVFNPKH